MWVESSRTGLHVNPVGRSALVLFALAGIGCSSTSAPVETARTPPPPFHKRALRNERLARKLRANGANVLASMVGESFGIFDERAGQLSHVCGLAASGTAFALGASFADANLPAPPALQG